MLYLFEENATCIHIWYKDIQLLCAEPFNNKIKSKNKNSDIRTQFIAVHNFMNSLLFIAGHNLKNNNN